MFLVLYINQITEEIPIRNKNHILKEIYEKMLIEKINFIHIQCVNLCLIIKIWL